MYLFSPCPTCMQVQKREERPRWLTRPESKSVIILLFSPWPTCRFRNAKRGLEESTSRYVFVKDLVLVPTDEGYKDNLPTGYRHVFLIRDPLLVYHSYRRAKYTMSLPLLTGDARDEEKYDIERDDPYRKLHDYFRYLHDFWRYVRDNHDSDPIVVNSQDLVRDPARVLPRFCELTGLPYSESLLQWNASTDPLKKWRSVGLTMLQDFTSFFGRAVNSSEFLPPERELTRQDVTKDVQRLADAAMPYYTEMNKHKIWMIIHLFANS